MDHDLFTPRVQAVSRIPTANMGVETKRELIGDSCLNRTIPRLGWIVGAVSGEGVRYCDREPLPSGSERALPTIEVVDWKGVVIRKPRLTSGCKWCF